MGGDWKERFRAWLFLRQQRQRDPVALRAFHAYSANQRLPPDALAALNGAKRRHLLAYAFETIPYYRDRFRALGLTEKDLADPQVWGSIPILTRSDVVTQFESIRAPGLKDGEAVVSVTGGTTGQVVKVLHDAAFPVSALAWRTVGWWGVLPGADFGRIWRIVHTPMPGKRAWRKKNRRNPFLVRTRQVRLDATQMGDDEIRRFLQEWNTVRPSLLVGYVGAIHHVACWIQQQGIRVHRPRAVQATSAPLSSVHRRIIEAAFQAPVYDQYGSCEVYWLAAECRRRRGLHLFSDVRHLECVAESGRICAPDEEGRILVTDLENRVFPLIRYEIGDRGRLLSRTCDCGITLPLMDPVKGRVIDLIRLPDGTSMEGLSAIFDDCPEAVRSFQLRQAADYSIILRVVPNRDNPSCAEAIRGVHAALEAKLRGRAPLRLETVPEILSDRGKTRYIISDVAKG